MSDFLLLYLSSGWFVLFRASDGDSNSPKMGGLEKKSRLMNKKEIGAYLVTGHALIEEALPTAHPVHKISIIPRGISALGYTPQLPTEDRYLMTK